MAQMNLSTKQKHTQTERPDCGCWGGVGKERDRDGLGDRVGRCKLLHLEWIQNKVLM